jgi:hypothetical protein
VLDRPQQRVGVFDALGVVLSDVSDLFQKEIQLAKAEVAENIQVKLRSGAWGAGAGVAGFFSILFLLEGVVFALASNVMPVYWACLLVAVVMAAVAGVLFSKCKADAERDIAPERGIRNVKEDIKVIKEQLS